jgi:hypothetical protein
MRSNPGNQDSGPTGATPAPGNVFTAGQIAEAFSLSQERVERAIREAFGPRAVGGVNDKQAQDLAEELLADRPLDQREAALLTLGAFTPRADDAWGLGDKAPGEESDRLQHEHDRFDRAHLGADAGDEPSQ